MATVKELRARFTAQAEGMKAVARSVRKDLQSIGDTTEKSTKRVNGGFGDLNKSLSTLDKNLQKVGDTKGFEDLNKSLRKVRTELSSTGKISAESMKELQISVKGAKDHFVSLGDEGKVGLARLGHSIKLVDAQLGSIDFGSLKDDLADVNDELGDTDDKLGDVNKQVRDTEDGMDKLRDTVMDVSIVMRALKMSLVGLIPAASPAIASLTTATMGLASSFAAAGIGVVGFGAVAVSVLGQVFEASEEVAKLEEKIANADSAEERIAAQKELAAVYGDMSEAQRGALKELQNFKSFWEDFTKQFEDPTFDAFGESLALAKNVLTGLAPTIDATAAVVNELIQEMNNAVIAGGLTGFFEWLETHAAESLYSFAHITGNVLGGFFNLLKVFSPIGAGMEEGLVSLTEKFAAWASTVAGSKGFQEFIDYSMRNGPTLLGIIGDLVNFLIDLGILLAPVGELMLNIIKNVTGFISSLTDGALALLQWEGLTPIFSKINDGIQKAKDSLGTFKEFLQGIFALFTGDTTEGINILEKLGLSASEVQQIINAINLIKVYLNLMIQNAVTGFQMMSQFIKDAWNTIFPFIQPLLNNIVAFVGSIVSQITKFWEENGAQIMKAVQNAFNFILGVIQFIMPAVLFIINMVWTSIKGVIQGALNIIMGLIKIFAGLFTGDFKKMWEGVKQLFFGAIEFVWNLINLLLIGRILKGIGSFITAAKNFFTKLWNDTLNIFKNLDTSVSNVVSKFIGYLKNSWNTAKDNAVTIFTNIKNTISGIWDDIVKGAKELPGKIGDGIKNMAGKAVDGVKSLGNKLASGLENVVNLITQQGINTVLSKLGVDEKHRIPKLDIPEYRKGTDGHKGGLAILGDGKKKELYITPDGQIGLSPATDTLMNLPKGTQVLSGENTKKVLGNIPAYNTGAGWLNNAISGAKEVGEAAWKGTKKAAGKAKDFAFDVWEYASDPKKLLSKVWDTLNLPKIDISGAFGQIAKGSISMIKDKAVGFVKGLIPSLDFGGGGSSVNITGGASAWRGMIIKAAQAMGEALLPSELNGIIAQIQRESGGNQKITQSSAVDDINMRNNNPARGLLQYIPQTFRAYSVKGFNNIYDGYHQLLAFFNNTSWRRDLPYGRRGWGPRGGRKINGFFEGARVAVKQLAWIAEKGAEYIIPTDGGQRAYDLWLQAGEENGFSDADNNNSPTQSRGTSSQPIIINPAPVIIDGHELTEIIFPYVDAKQSSELSHLLSVYGGKG